jgi:hypothetical protein
MVNMLEGIKRRPMLGKARVTCIAHHDIRSPVQKLNWEQKKKEGKRKENEKK